MRTRRMICCPHEDLPACAELTFEMPYDLAEHLHVQHDGQRLPMTLPIREIEDTRPPRLRIMYCRFCATKIETKDPDLPPYCPAHVNGLTA